MARGGMIRAERRLVTADVIRPITMRLHVTTRNELRCKQRSKLWSPARHPEPDALHHFTLPLKELEK